MVSMVDAGVVSVLVMNLSVAGLVCECLCYLKGLVVCKTSMLILFG